MAAVATHVVVFLAHSVPLAGSEERMQLADSFVAARLFLRSVSLSIPENSPSLRHIFKTFISAELRCGVPFKTTILKKMFSET